MKKLILILISITLIFPTFSFAAMKETIRFATEPTYPPFEYVNEQGQIKGFDIDIANALCQQLKVHCTFAAQSFDGLIPSLNLGKFDALIAALGITPAREKQLNFTQSYYQPSASFVASKKNHFLQKDLIGKTIGAQQGSTFAQYLYDQYKGKVKVKLYASIQDAFLDLIAGRVEAVIADRPIAISWLKESNHMQQYELVGGPLTNDQYFGAGYGIGFRKNEKELLQDFNQALIEIKKNGTYDKIVANYFGVE
jgi:arginine transport system substrate-binding protein